MYCFVRFGVCFLQADKDKIEEELKRLKQAESWVRRSTSPTSPSLSPAASVEELTAVSYGDGPVKGIRPHIYNQNYQV